MSNWLIKLATLAIVLAAAVAIAQGPRVELQAVLPDSLEGFTEAVQDTFKIAIATSASAGCESKM